MWRTLSWIAAITIALLVYKMTLETNVTPNTDPFASTRDAYLEAVNRTSARDFVESQNLAEKLGASYFNSVDWSSIVFRDVASPLHIGNARKSFHVATLDTFDFIRYDYEVNGLIITTIESATFIYTEIKGGAGSVVNLALAAKWARVIYNLPENIEFNFINPRDGTFSNSPTRGLVEMKTWIDRIDGIIKPIGSIGFLVYKVRLEFDDFYKDPSTWFPDQVRGTSR